MLVVRTPCASCSSLLCIATVLFPHKITGESQENEHVENLVFVVATVISHGSLVVLRTSP